MTPQVRPLVGWLLSLSSFPKRAENYTSMLLSQHLFSTNLLVLVDHDADDNAGDAAGHAEHQQQEGLKQRD